MVFELQQHKTSSNQPAVIYLSWVLHLGDTHAAVCECFVYVLQYDVKRRISADESLKSRYFDSLGQGVHALSDGQCTVCH